MRAKAAEQGMEIVFDEEYPLDSTEFSDLVRRVRLSAPELVIGATYLNDSIAFVQEAKRQQLSPEAMAFTVGPALPEFGNALGDDANGIIGVVSWMRSGRVPMAYDFSFRFKEQFGCDVRSIHTWTTLLYTSIVNSCDVDGTAYENSVE